MLYKVDKKTHQVDIPPEVLQIPEFKAILESDKSETKEVANKEFAYIFYMTDYKSPYMSQPIEQRAKSLKSDFIQDPTWEPSEAVLKAIEKYKVFQYTPSMRLLEAAEVACDKLTNFYLTVDLNQKNKLGQLLYKHTDLSKSLKDVGGIVASLQAIREQIKKEIFTKKTRGQGGEASEFEQ